MQDWKDLEVGGRRGEVVLGESKEVRLAGRVAEHHRLTDADFLQVVWTSEDVKLVLQAYWLLHL